MQYPQPPLFLTTTTQEKSAKRSASSTDFVVTWECLGGLALHGFCGGSLLYAQDDLLRWLSLLLLWLTVAVWQGHLLRTTLARPKGLVTPTAVLSLLLLLTENTQQTLFLGAGLLLLGASLAAGYWRNHQDDLSQEQASLRAQIDLYAAWQDRKQAQLERELEGHLLLEQHQANNLLCGIVMHANLAASLLAPLATNHSTPSHSTPSPDHAHNTQQLHQNIHDLIEASRKLQHLFAAQRDLTPPEQLRTPTQGQHNDICDAFAQAQQRAISAIPHLTIRDLSEYNGILLLPEGTAPLSDFFFHLFCMLSKHPTLQTIDFRTDHFPHAHPPALRVEIQGIPHASSNRNRPHQQTASSVTLFLSWLRLFLDLHGGRLISPPKQSPPMHTHPPKELSHLVFDLPALQITPRLTQKTEENALSPIK